MPNRRTEMAVDVPALHQTKSLPLSKLNMLHSGMLSLKRFCKMIWVKHADNLKFIQIVSQNTVKFLAWVLKKNYHILGWFFIEILVKKAV